MDILVRINEGDASKFQYFLATRRYKNRKSWRVPPLSKCLKLAAREIVMQQAEEDLASAESILAMREDVEGESGAD